MRNTLKKVLPKKLVDTLRQEYLFRLNDKNLKNLKTFDSNRFKKHAFGFNRESDDYSYDNTRAKITFHYHSIEKGLSNANIRLGFGKRAFTQLFYTMDIFLEKGYPTTDTRFQQALSVINAYIKYHDDHEYEVSEIKERVQKYRKYELTQFTNVGGASVIKKEELPDFKKINFEQLSSNRHSVRDFGLDDINITNIKNAIQIASTSPSVCNRQSVSVYLLDNPQAIEKALLIQNGLRGNGENIRNLLIVTSNKEYMKDAQERNQTYIDGGIFLMNLVYGLTYENIASCILNADFTTIQEENIRDLVNIKDSEDVIAFVAVGSFPDTIKFANSPRETTDNILKLKI